MSLCIWERRTEVPAPSQRWGRKRGQAWEAGQENAEERATLSPPGKIRTFPPRFTQTKSSFGGSLALAQGPP